MTAIRNKSTGPSIGDRLNLGGIQLPPDTVTQTLVVYGGKGMGKTNLAAVLAEECDRTGLRFSLLDPIGVNWGLRFSPGIHGQDGVMLGGLPVLILGGIHGDLPIEPTGGAVVADFVADESVSCVVDFSRKPSGEMWSVGEQIRFVTDYAVRLYQRQGEKRRPLLQIIDEAGRFVPQNIPAGAVDIAKCVGALERLVELGRNVGVGVGLITQRSARMNKSVSELAECMIAFRTVGPRSVKAVLDWLGEHVEKKRHHAIVEKLRSLPRGSALIVSPGWLEVEGVFPIRKRWTFDSSKTPEAGDRAAAVDNNVAPIPDLERYAQRMAATIEKAAADDPKALRKKVAELEQRVREAEAAPRVDTVSLTAETIEVPAITKDSLDSLAVFQKALYDALDRADHRVELLEEQRAVAVALAEAARGSFDRLGRDIDRAEGLRDRAVALRQSAAHLTRSINPRHQPAAPFIPPTHRLEMAPLRAGAPVQSSANLEDWASLSDRQRRILGTIAMLNYRGIPANAVTVARWMNIHPNTGSFSETLKELRLAGWLVGFRLARATGASIEAGVEAALAALPSEPHRKLLRIMVDAGRPLSVAELAEAMGRHKNTGSFGQLIARLRQMQLIQPPHGGPLSVADATYR